MSDYREMLSMLVPGAINMDGSGGGSDVRQQLTAALARVRPRWAAELLLARYANDRGALKQVSYALMQELAGMTYPEKHPPGTLRRVVYAVMSEYAEPPPCPSCYGTAMTWQMVEGAVTSGDCSSCSGTGRRRLTNDELAQTLDRWNLWAPRYAALYHMLRAHERAALETLRGAMQEAPCGF